MFEKFGKWFLGIAALVGGILAALSLSSKNNKNKKLVKGIIKTQDKELKVIKKRQKQIQKKTKITNKDIKETAEYIKKMEQEKQDVKTKEHKKSASDAASSLRDIAKRKRK